MTGHLSRMQEILPSDRQPQRVNKILWYSSILQIEISTDSDKYLKHFLAKYWQNK